MRSKEYISKRERLKPFYQIAVRDKTRLKPLVDQLLLATDVEADIVVIHVDFEKLNAMVVERRAT